MGVTLHAGDRTCRLGPCAGTALIAALPPETVWPMAIDFSLSPQLEEIRLRVRTFVADIIKPEEHRLEPEVADSDPTLIQTKAYQDGDEWVINGHKWFIAGARRADIAILVCCIEENLDIPQAVDSAFISDLPQEGWNDVHAVETMHGGTDHSEIVITDLRVHNDQMLGGRGQGHLLGQYRLGPARLAHCMRWIAQAETALDMMVDRSLNRFSHGLLLAEKQGIQWMIADSSMEIYQAKLTVLMRYPDAHRPTRNRCLHRRRVDSAGHGKPSDPISHSPRRPSIFAHTSVLASTL